MKHLPTSAPATGGLESHRGTLILVLGILSLFLCVFFTGIPAWIMGKSDLKKIRDGAMDPEGEGTTKAGMVCGMISFVIACVVGFAFGGAFIGWEAHDLHLTGKHIGGDFMGGIIEALLGLCIGAIIGGVAGYKIIKAKTPRASIRIIITLLIFCIGYRVIWVVGIEVRQRGIEVRQRIDESNDIFLAAKNGNIEAVKQHIAAGTDVNARDNGGSTPLHQAAINGHKEIAELLIANGANVNATARVGFTSLHVASHNGHKEIVELLIAKGADVNAKQRLNWSNGGRTPLHLAAREGHKEVIELLIAKGADVNAKDVEGQTPLDWAKEEKHKEIADLLRKHGGKTAKELKAEGK